MKIKIVNNVPQSKTEAEIRLVRVPAGGGCPELLVAETPVTEKQWLAVMGGSVETGENFPKVNVSYNEAELFCKKLSEEAGYTFRMPTEVEFCRCLGDEPKELEKYAVFDQAAIAKVKTKLPNEFGLFDMRGDVWEWTATAENGRNILRGGSWFNNQVNARAVSRNYPRPALRNNYFGFRVLCCRPPSS